MDKEIEIYVNATVSVWRRNSPSFMTEATREKPFKIPINDDIVRVVITNTIKI